MTDTQRTRSELLTMFADNVTGQIGSQDLRDWMVTVMEAEFAYAGDFWKQPAPAQMTDKTIRGWKDYSQIIDSVCSFGNVLVLTKSGTWRLATVSDSALNAVLGLAGNTYAVAESQAIILRRGLMYNSAFSVAFDSKIGRPVYLLSGAGEGSMSITITTNSVKIIGVVEPQSIGGSVGGILRFDPDWAVVGS